MTAFAVIALKIAAKLSIVVLAACAPNAAANAKFEGSWILTRVPFKKFNSLINNQINS